MTAHDAIVLSGGAARRMGGVDKPGSTVGGRSMLQRAVDACAGAGRVVVVGPTAPQAAAHVVVTRERPPGSGPVAALAAGLALVTEPVVVVLAADLPRIDPAAVRRLLEELERSPEVDAVVPLDAEGHEQRMAAVYRTAALRQAVARTGDPAGVSLRAVLADLPRATPQEPELWGRLADVDTPADLDRARLRVFVEMLSDDLGLDLDPAAAEDLVLAVARDVAHTVARPAAPVTTFLLGLAAGARTGTAGDLPTLEALQQQVATTLERYQQQ